MSKNFYELLEVDKNASSDVIDKAYKTLVKKYHPDLKDESKKQENEEIIKKINEAYETLSNKEKRLEYDKLLEKDYISIEEYNKLYDENIYLKNEINNISKENNYIKNIAHHNTPDESINNLENQQNMNYEDFNNKINNAINKAYHDAYIQDLKNRGYKIKYKKTLKDYLRILITITTILFIFAILSQIPLIKNYLLDFYNKNTIIKTLVNTIFNK